MRYVWIASAKYKDGTSIEKKFPYLGGTIREDNETQYRLECWLLSRHEDCIWYSVIVEEELDED